MRARIAFLFLALVPSVTASQWHTIPDADSVMIRSPQEVTVRAGATELNVRVLADDLIRVRFRPSLNPAPDHSWAVVKTNWASPHVTIRDTPGTLTLTTNEIALVVQKSPLRLSFRDRSGAVINEDHPGKGMSWSGGEVRAWKVMPGDEEYFGFGEKSGPLMRRGLHMTMWNADIPAYTAATDPLYQSIPFFYGILNGRAYGLFLDNTSRSSFDMGKEARDQYSFGTEEGDLTYYFFYGPSPSKVLSRFTELVGRMPLPPLWSLGYQQCRWSYKTEARVREIARGFRSRSIPCDVIYLDIDYMDGFRIFTWNRQSFPSPATMIRDLGEDGFKIAVIVDPGIKVDSSYAAFRSGLLGEHFLRYPDGTLYTGKVWPGVCAFPDFTSAAGRTWWGDQFGGLVADGVQGWWNDMNEPSVFDVPTKTVELSVLHENDGRHSTHSKSHNVYGMLMTRATYEGVRRLRPDERPFVLTRASYAGGWRYSAAWTGDNVSSWEHLGLSLAMCLNLSISGQPFVGSDIGGFIGDPSGELYARWLQLGVFTPLMRSHSDWQAKNKEPWEYGPEFTDINRATINLRYQLMPYIYTTMADAAHTGIPAMRPMMFDHAGETRLLENDSQFMFGQDILVAPVLGQGETRKDVELPAGAWYEYWTGTRTEGGTRTTVAAPVERIPFFVRAGAVIPMRQIVQHTGEAPINPLTLLVYPATGGTHRPSLYYEDDGISFAYEKGSSFRRSSTVTASNAGCRLRISAAEGSYAPPARMLLVKFQDCATEPGGVSLDGRPVEKMSAGGIPPHWSYDGATRTVSVTLPDRRSRIDISVAKEPPHGMQGDR